MRQVQPAGHYHLCDKPPKPLGLSVPSSPSCPIWHLFCSLAPQIKHGSHTGPRGPLSAAYFKAVNSGPFLTAGPNVSACAGCWKPLLRTCTRQKKVPELGWSHWHTSLWGQLPHTHTPHASVCRWEYRVLSASPHPSPWQCWKAARSGPAALSSAWCIIDGVSNCAFPKVYRPLMKNSWRARG